MNISQSNLRDAFYKVKANNGCAGVDGVTLGMFERNLNNSLQIIEYQIMEGRYSPLPLMKILVAKKSGEPRKLCIPPVRDRVVHKAVLELIEPVLEKEFEECSYAYRRGRSVRQVIDRVRALYDQGYQWVVDADIDAFFDNVSHRLLEEKINQVIHDPAVRRLMVQWMNAEVWDGKSLSRLKKGIPQGSAISPILANLFLDELDEAMLAKGYHYLRYADDYVVLCKTREKAFQALDISKKVLKEMLLELDDEEVASFDHGFKYLGVIFMRNMVMKPFERQMRKRKVLFYPGPFDIERYLRERNGV